MASMADVVTGTPDDPGVKGPETVRVRRGPKAEFYPVVRQASWYTTHFLYGRTKPCLGDGCECHSLEKPVRPRWSGFLLCAVRFAPLKIVNLALTQNCWDSCELLRNKNLDLRYYKISVWRDGRGDKGRVYCQLDYLANRRGCNLDLPYTILDVLTLLWFTPEEGQPDPGQADPEKWQIPTAVCGPANKGGQ
jgi:hypothetical protein